MIDLIHYNDTQLREIQAMINALLTFRKVKPATETVDLPSVEEEVAPPSVDSLITSTIGLVTPIIPEEVKPNLATAKAPTKRKKKEKFTPEEKEAVEQIVQAVESYEIVLPADMVRADTKIPNLEMVEAVRTAEDSYEVVLPLQVPPAPPIFEKAMSVNELLDLIIKAMADKKISNAEVIDIVRTFDCPAIKDLYTISADQYPAIWKKVQENFK